MNRIALKKYIAEHYDVPAAGKAHELQLLNAVFYIGIRTQHRRHILYFDLSLLRQAALRQFQIQKFSHIHVPCSYILRIVCPCIWLILLQYFPSESSEYLFLKPAHLHLAHAKDLTCLSLRLVLKIIATGEYESRIVNKNK